MTAAMQQKAGAVDNNQDFMPLSDAEWRSRLGEVALACAGSFPGEEPIRIREIFDLLARAPSSAALAGLTLPEPVRVEQLIAARAGECAVLAVFGSEAGYLLSRGGSGQHLASVVLPGATEEVNAGGDSLVLALIGALALALAEASPDAAVVTEMSAGNGLRLN